MIAAAAIQSAADLAVWLAGNGIEPGGANGTKPIADLWQEIRRGESTLDDNPPRRAVNVVEVILQRDSFMLLELEQELRDGQIRRRNRPPTEKLSAGETVVAAARRCLLEELGVTADQVGSLQELGPARIHELDSPSYPGLPTRYTIHRVEATVPSLPDNDFRRDNVGAGESDPVVAHLWGWRPYAL